MLKVPGTQFPWWLIKKVRLMVHIYIIPPDTIHFFNYVIIASR